MSRYSLADPLTSSSAFASLAASPIRAIMSPTEATPGTGMVVSVTLGIRKRWKTEC